MRTNLKGACCLLALSAPVAFALTKVDGYTLRWTPKEGDTATYETIAKLDVKGIGAAFKGRQTQKILKVENDGSFTLQNNVAAGTVTYAGNTTPSPTSISVTLYKPNGEVVQITGEYAKDESYRLANLQHLHRPDKPVNVGDTWTFDIKADPAHHTVAVQGKDKLEGEEQIDIWPTLKITQTTKETEGAQPGTIESTFWVDKTNFSLVKYTSTWTNVIAAGAADPLSGTMTMTRMPDTKPPQ